MIYVSQGHEKGIGLEIFLKSILLFSKEVQQKFFLAVDEDCFNENLKNINCHKDLYKNLNIFFCFFSLLKRKSNHLMDGYSYVTGCYQLILTRLFGAKH